MKHVFLIALVATVFVSHPLRAQTFMNIYRNNGTVLQLPINTIDSITYTTNGVSTSSTLHSCGTANVHNPELVYGLMTDQEGNVYKTIVIGNQEWMAENLNTSIYRNGDAIPTNLDNSTWGFFGSGAWTYLNNDESNACPYGKLYNWFACVDARHLCPVGWHVPSDAEWSVLTYYLGGEAVAGGKMKTTGTIQAATGLWDSPNTAATNSSGFSGVPGGFRYGTSGGSYGQIASDGFWWTSSENFYMLYRHLRTHWGASDWGEHSGNYGYSVRCLRD
jgi:uncharacterized protein (TIGR02145 family)